MTNLNSTALSLYSTYGVHTLNSLMESLSRLTPAHCILLAVDYASQSDVHALQRLLSLRPDVFEPEVALRVILTYLPENLNPPEYTGCVQAIIRRVASEEDGGSDLDIAHVRDLSNANANRRVRKLHLLPLTRPECPTDASLDPLTCFLIHRICRIEAETGLLTLAPRLVEPFLEDSEPLRRWFVSVVLPLLRWGYEYYPDATPPPTVQTFDAMGRTQAVDTLLQNALHATRKGTANGHNLGRDLRALVGPWVQGSGERKRRKLSGSRRRSSLVAGVREDSQRGTAVTAEAQDSHIHDDWDAVFEWMVHNAVTQFGLVSNGILDWNGPPDVDLGGYDNNQGSVGGETGRELERRYAQAAMASIYAADSNASDTIQRAHQVLARMAEILGYAYPSPLSVNAISEGLVLDKDTTIMPVISPSALDVESLLRSDSQLTTPNNDAFSLLSMLVYSAYVFGTLGHNITIRKTALLRFFSDSEDQLKLLERITHNLTTGKKKDAKEWDRVRTSLVWLLSWGRSVESGDDACGFGVFSKIKTRELEKRILEAFLETANYTLAIKTYTDPESHYGNLTADQVLQVVLDTALRQYDNASNGNRTRGGMKKASDIIAAFRPHYRKSPAFQRCEALLAATHALSFYSLTLQHGVPFQPVNVRVSQDPLALLGKVLDQNPKSYTKLDDLIEIGQNLVAAGVAEQSDIRSAPKLTSDELERRKRTAARRVIGMAIEAALAEDDFETAYSYVMNRLNPLSSSSISANDADAAAKDPSSQSNPTGSKSEDEDDISWRAAFNAGKQKTASLASSHASIASSTPLGLRRLEQRMELLSQALLLAPASSIPEILAVWRRCEEEMTTLLEREAAEETRFKDRAERRIPGGFDLDHSPAAQPARREIGRAAVEEAPMGLFDVARGAAAAFSKTAFAATQASPVAGGQAGHARAGSAAGSDVSSDGEGRVRKRDMVANAVTGGLASGLGWVLGEYFCFRAGVSLNSFNVLTSN